MRKNYFILVVACLFLLTNCEKETIIPEEVVTETANLSVEDKDAENQLKYSSFYGIGVNIVNIAMHEKGRYLKDVGKDRTSYPYRLSNYTASGEPWCSEFVSWCYKAANWPFTGGGKKYDWMLDSHSKIRDWFKSSSTTSIYVYRNSSSSSWNNLRPNPGDYIRYIWSDGKGHSGIIRYADGPDLYTIEGNRSDKVNTRTIHNYKSWIRINGIGARREY